jgi:hypothetical protein
MAITLLRSITMLCGTDMIFKFTSHMPLNTQCMLNMLTATNTCNYVLIISLFMD